MNEDNGDAAVSKIIRLMLILNSLSSILKLVTYLMTAFLLTPILVHGLGEHAYGLWVIVLSVMGVAGIADFGFQQAVVRAVATSSSLPGEQRYGGIIGSALVFYGGMAICIMVVGGGLIALGVPGWFVSPGFVPIINLLLLVGGSELVLTMVGGVFLCVLQGLQLYWKTNLIGSAAIILRAGLTYGCVINGFGVLSVAVVSVSVALVEYVIYACLSLIRLQGQSCRPSRALLQELVPFASKSFLLTVFGRVEVQVPPLFVGAILGSGATALYAVVSQLVLYVRQLTWSASVSLMPEFGRLERGGSCTEIRALYLMGSRYVMLLILPILVLIVTLGQQFLRIWIGEQFAQEGKWLIVWLVGSVLLTTAQPLAGRVLTGLNRQELLIKVSAVTCGVTCVVAAIVIPQAGVVGIGVAAVSATAIGQFWTLMIIERELEISGRDYFTQAVARPLGIAIGFLILSLVVVGTIRIATYAELILVGALGGSCYLLFAYYLGLHAGERAFLQSRLLNAIR